jgi:cytochrome c-type biogenesis protein CcmH
VNPGRPVNSIGRVNLKLLFLVLTVSLCILTCVPARALDANGQLEDPALQARFERIAKDLRCLVCQNESIADSNVELAADLRRQVQEMLVAGKSDDAIFDFMTERYGDFVRFNPPLEPKTLLIWGAPFIVLLLGIGIIFRVVHRRSRMPLDEEPSTESPGLPESAGSPGSPAPGQPRFPAPGQR